LFSARANYFFHKTSSFKKFLTWSNKSNFSNEFCSSAPPRARTKNVSF
jgi:hypothetical protein